MNFEPGYLETDAPGAIFPMIRAADSVLEYSHVLERRAQETNWQFFVERREFSKFANCLSCSSAKAATLLGAFSQIPLKLILAHF